MCNASLLDVADQSCNAKGAGVADQSRNAKLTGVAGLISNWPAAPSSTSTSFFLLLHKKALPPPDPPPSISLLPQLFCLFFGANRRGRTNRQSNKTVINWEEHHITWVDMWNAQRQHRVENDETPDTDEAAYLRHLEWMRTEYRVIHKAAWTRSDCLDLLPSEAADAAFNNSIRETVGAHLDYGPLHDQVKVANRCRTLAALLSCHGVSSTDVRARAQYTMDVQSSARPSASQPRASSARPSSSGAHVSSSRAHEEEIEEEDESDNEAADQDYIEFGASQMEDAPQSSQPTQPTEATRRASSRNIRRPGWQNTPEGYVTKGKMAAKRGRKSHFAQMSQHNLPNKTVFAVQITKNRREKGRQRKNKQQLLEKKPERRAVSESVRNILFFFQGERPPTSSQVSIATTDEMSTTNSSPADWHGIDHVWTAARIWMRLQRSASRVWPSREKGPEEATDTVSIA
ncbi:hypothetical protein D1007_55197 [Hordeum vulgare]|nr:hypothetical protein D1007_55197 [Hordeum vulgare]